MYNFHCFRFFNIYNSLPFNPNGHRSLDQLSHSIPMVIVPLTSCHFFPFTTLTSCLSCPLAIFCPLLLLFMSSFIQFCPSFCMNLFLVGTYQKSGWQNPVKVLMWSTGYVVPGITDDSEWCEGQFDPLGHWHSVFVFTSSTSGLFRTVNNLQGSFRWQRSFWRREG